MTMLLRLRDSALIQRALSYSLGTTLYKLHIVLLVPLFAYAFTAAEAGRLEIAMFTAGFMSAVAAANLSTVVSQRYVQSSLEDRPRALAFGVTSALFVTAVGMVVAIGLTATVAATVPELQGRSVLAGMALAGGVLNALVANLCLFLQLKSAPRAFNITYALWAAIVLVGTALYLLFIAPEAESFVLATLLAGVVCSVVGVAWFRAELRQVVRLPDRRSAVVSTLAIDMRRASRLLPLVILTWALLYMDRKILASLAGIEEVGIYGLAVRIANGVTLALGPLQAAWWDAAMNQSQTEARSSLRACLRAHAVIMVAAVAGSILFAQGPFPSLLGDWFGPGVRYIPVLVVCATLMSAYVLPYALLTRDGRYREIITAYAVAVAVNVAGNVALDGRHGAAGACMANLLAYICLNVVAAWPVRHEIISAIGSSRRTVLSLAGAASAMAIAALLVPSVVLTGF
jgi:O-antigen/teichoic acid export membrane protein